MKEKRVEEIHDFAWEELPAGLVRWIRTITAPCRLRKFIAVRRRPQQQAPAAEQNTQNK